MLSTVALIAALSGLVLAGDFGGYGGGYGDSFGDGHSHISYVETPIITTHHVKEPVISYVENSVHTLDHGYEAVYTKSHKPIVISHGYSYPLKKSSFGLTIGFHKGGDSYGY